MVFVTNNQPPEILKPGKQAFNFPSTSITSKLPAVLGWQLFTPTAVWRDHLNTTLMQKLLVKTVAIIGFIANKLVRSIASKTIINSCLDKLYFMGRSAFHVSGDRKTRSVCDGHDLGAFAALCLADSKPHFFAGTKLPSMKASRMSIPPRSYRSCASSWAMRLKTPNWTHCWKRLWQVWYGGYRASKSFQGAPVRNIHNIPFKTLRGSRGLRPRGSLRCFADSIMGSSRFHCSFVSSILIIWYIQDVMSSHIFNFLCDFIWLRFCCTPLNRHIFFEMASN